MSLQRGARAVLLERWSRLFRGARHRCARAEEARRRSSSGAVSKRTSARSEASTFELLESYRGELRYLFIVSQVSLTLLEEEAAEDIRVTVERAAGSKCERCWNYSTRVGTFTRYPAACERCVEALAEIEAEGGAS